eukprot:g56633.t1
MQTLSAAAAGTKVLEDDGKDYAAVNATPEPPVASVALTFMPDDITDDHDRVWCHVVLEKLDAYFNPDRDAVAIGNGNFVTFYDALQFRADVA